MQHLHLTPLAAGAGIRMIRAPKALADRELMVRGRDYTLRFGHRHTTARLGIAGGEDLDVPPLLGLSSDVLDDLLLVPGERCRLHVEQAHNQVIFGPLVGVLVSPRFVKAISQEAIPTSARLHGLGAQAQHAAVYYFTADGIDWESKTAVGWVPTEGGCWSRRLMPLPDIIYDRAVFGRSQDRTRVAYTRTRFSREPGFKFINARHYLDKWWLHQRLFAHPQVRGYLPNTARYRGLTDLKDFLGRYRQVFIKSFYGSGGMEVISIQAVGSGSYICHTCRRMIVLEDLDRVSFLIRRSLGTDELIIQEGIDLVQYEGSNVDLRSLVQKDDSGDWCKPQVVFRVAAGDRPMTNLHQHGRAMPCDKLMPLTLGGRKKVRTGYAELSDLSLLLARHIEHEYGPFGEIGLDLALDKNGRFWFLEANAKPDKGPDSFEESVNHVYPQFENIFAYARFLTNFTEPSWCVE